MPQTIARTRPVTRRFRWTWIDTALLLVFALALGALLWRAGGVFSYKWNWSTVWPFVYRFDEATKAWVPNILFEGLATTLRLAFWGILVASVIGTVMGFARVSKKLMFRLIGTAYVMLIRNIPPVVFVFVFVFFIASQIMPALGLGDRIKDLSPTARWWLSFLFGSPKLFDNFLLGLICLSVFSGAYVTEIVRGGIESIDKGQWEAARSLGLTRGRTLRLVILPQAIQRTIPPLAGQFISLIKDSSIVSLISIQDLTFLGNEVAATTTRVFEAWTIVALLYFFLCFSLSRQFARLEVRMGRFK